jgi:hypothetical protein
MSIVSFLCPLEFPDTLVFAIQFDVKKTHFVFLLKLISSLKVANSGRIYNSKIRPKCYIGHSITTVF